MLQQFKQFYFQHQAQNLSKSDLFHEKIFWEQKIQNIFKNNKFLISDN